MPGFDALGRLALGQLPAGTVPFNNQPLYPTQNGRRKFLPVPGLGLNPNILQNNFPNSQYFWDKPQRIRRNLVALDSSFNDSLFKNPIPIFNLSGPARRIAGFAPSSNPYNLNLYDVVAVANPFNQTDWSKAIRLRGAFDQSQGLNPNLSTNPLPFNQIDWAKPFRVPQARLDPPYPLNINLFANPFPVFNNLLGARPPRTIPDASQSYNQNLYSVVVTSLPFNQYDWAKPTRLPRAPFDLSLALNIGLIPAAVSVPFNQFSYPPTIRLKAPPLTPFPLLLPIVAPPIPLPTASKVIALDAAYGSSDVTRFYRSATPSQVVVGDNVAVLIDVGTVLDPAIPLRMFFTSPDGSVFSVSAYIGRPLGYTGKGIFEESTYAVCVLTGQQVSQHGNWLCYLQEGIFESSVQQFYIGPPTVLV